MPHRPLVATGRAVAVSGAVALATLVPVAPAQAAGLPGYCPDATGVTVVVDFRELGGGVVVRCSPDGNTSGLAALEGAGFTAAGTSRFGKGLVCRINGKPSPAEESCVNTPPTTAYWGYWSASNGGDWRYSTTGPTGRTPQPGSFEGWAFSLGRSETTAPAPGVAPVRPPAPAASSAPTRSATATARPPVTSLAPRPGAAPQPPVPTASGVPAPASTSGPAAVAPTTPPPSVPTAPGPAATSTTSTPPATAATPPGASTTGSPSSEPVVSFDLPEDGTDGGGSPVGALVSVAVVVLVAAVAGGVALRRRGGAG